MPDIEQASEHSFKNREALEACSQAGCYQCLEIFPTAEVEDFVDENNETALCPKCGIDSVLPETAGYPLDEATLQKLRDFWFEET